MHLKKIQQTGGFSIIIGSLCLAIYSIMFFFVLPFDKIKTDFSQLILNKYYTLNATIVFCGLLLLMYGYITIYTKIHSDSGKLGFISIILIELAYLLQICKVTWEIFLYPLICKNDRSIFIFKELLIKNDQSIQLFGSIASLLILISVILFSITIFKSKYFSKLSSIFILIGAIMYGTGPIFGAFVGISGIFIFSIGCILISGKLIKN